MAAFVPDSGSLSRTVSSGGIKWRDKISIARPPENRVVNNEMLARLYAV